MIDSSIKKLVLYGLEKNLVEIGDYRYMINRILEAMNLESFTDDGKEYHDIDLEQTLSELCDYAVSSGIIEDGIVSRDLLDTKLMGILTPRPSYVVSTFLEKYLESPEEATDFYYQFSRDTDYIRTYRIKKDMKWTYPCE